ncbi:hypothetical protein M0802_012625 [Mischocyttarus mexicanus]|nr:hypothetical protein M0802_012625 [Mischocyttarus mexicanus]
MTSLCDSNPAQYERNRRFGNLVHKLGQAAGGAKLPSIGLCLNASHTVGSPLAVFTGMMWDVLPVGLAFRGGPTISHRGALY